MERTEIAEARRRVTQGRTLYARLCQKNAEAEAAYREKIERLQATLDELEASK
jgi:hypothetical protein